MKTNFLLNSFFPCFWFSDFVELYLTLPRFYLRFLFAFKKYLRNYLPRSLMVLSKGNLCNFNLQGATFLILFPFRNLSRNLTLLSTRFSSLVLFFRFFSDFISLAFWVKYDGFNFISSLAFFFHYSLSCFNLANFLFFLNVPFLLKK